MTLFFISAAVYLAAGIVVRRCTYAGPEDDGWLWCVLLWPFVLVAMLTGYADDK